MSRSVGDFTERALIGRIQSRLPPPPAWMLVGLGDDAAVVEPERNRIEVLSVDAVVEGVHFDRAFTPPEAIGHRAIAVNLSDLAAMGAEPRLGLLSLAVPAAWPIDDFDRMIGAITGLAQRYRMHVAGGNLTRSPGPIVVDMTVMGTCKPRRTLVRSGAKPGDELYVTGALGAAGAGLQMLQHATIAMLQRGTTAGPAPATPDAARSTPDAARADACVHRYLYPEPRVRTGLLLARNRAATACIDLSDGLADGVCRIAEASGVGIVVDCDALPIDAGAREWFARGGADAVASVVGAGDDYELLFTVRPRTRGRLSAAARHGGVAVTRIGVCTDAPDVVLRTPEGSSQSIGAGFSHFR